MRYLIIVIACLYPPIASSLQWEDRQLFRGVSGTETLRVVSNTDTVIFAPIIDGFLIQNPRINVEYLVASSSDIYDEFRQSSAEFDVLISSAMDLQLKLVNDGYARRVEDINHLQWAQWRQSLFGFTVEPATMVVNKAAFANLPIPQSRQEMIQVLRANPTIFSGKVGTYDVRQSGLGYLFATQDARRSETYWRLMELIGGLEVKLFCCSGEMIEELANGHISVAYNVLGSYALARQDLADNIEVVLPADFQTIMMRSALVSADSKHPDAATSFLHYLTSAQWSRNDETPSPLPSLKSAADSNTQGAVIALEPSLMIYLDRMKRQLFVKEWENAVIQ